MGKVSRIAFGLNEDTKTMLVQIDLQNKDHIIHPGMFANVTFNVSFSDSTLSVPNQAVGSYEQQTFIYKVIPIDSGSPNLNWENGVKCIVKKVNVQLGIHTADYSQIKYGGLKAGDRVIISGNGQCADGSQVIAKEKAVVSTSAMDFHQLIEQYLMKTYKIVFLLLLIGTVSYSQPDLQVSKKIPVNLPTLRLAGANNLTIKQYELQYQLSLAEIDKAKEWFLPTILIGPTMHYLNGAAMQTTGAVLKDVTQKELWLGGGIAGILDFNDGIFNVMAKKQQSAAVKFENQAQRNTIIITAITDYYDLMVAQFNYVQLFNLLSQADTLTQQIKVQVDAGIRYQSEYLLAQSNYNHISVELTGAEVQMRLKSNALLSILNIDTNAVLVSSDTGMGPIEIVKSVADTGLAGQIYTKPPGI